MARLTLFFKNKLLQTHLLNTGVIYIGRDATNNIAIDSLAVAPIHAVVNLREGDCLIKQVSSEHPLIVNGQPCQECYLQDNDRISIGKHSLLYTTSGFISESKAPETDQTPANFATVQNDIKDANLQVMDGKHIGRIIPIKKAITRMGRSGEGVVIISKRQDGYFISALESNANLTINQKTLDHQIIKLSHEDLINIDNISMQFFLV